MDVSEQTILDLEETVANWKFVNMVNQMDLEGFGNCTNYYECQAACPKEINVKFIAQMNREYFRALNYKEKK